MVVTNSIIMPWEETDDYIRSGHGDLEDVETCRTIDISEPKGIKAIYCKSKSSGKWSIQSYLFSKSESWTMEKAKEWFAAHRQSFEQSFSWAPIDRIEALKAMGLGEIYRVCSPHVGRTLVCDTLGNVHEATLDAEEVKRLARTAIDKAWNLNHGRSVDAVTFDAEFEDDAVEQFVYCRDEEVNRLFSEGKIIHVSPEWCPRSIEMVDGIAPKGIVLTGFAFLTEDQVPGDGLSTIEKYQSLPGLSDGNMVLVSKIYLQSLEMKQSKQPSEKESGHKSPPKDYPEDRNQYADPTNYKYPLDTEEHARAALAYFSKSENREEYTAEEQEFIWNRIYAACKKFKIDVEKEKQALGLVKQQLSDEYLMDQINSLKTQLEGLADSINRLWNMLYDKHVLTVEGKEIESLEPKYALHAQLEDMTRELRNLEQTMNVAVRGHDFKADLEKLKQEAVEEFKQSLKIAPQLQSPIIGINTPDGAFVASSQKVSKPPLTDTVRWRIMQKIRERASDDEIRDLIE